MNRRTGFAIAAIAAIGWVVLRAREEACGSGAIDRGNGWLEMGGPTAFMVFDPPYVAPVQARMSWIRIAVPSNGRRLAVDVRERGASGAGRGIIQSDGRPMSDFEPSPLSDLPGRMHFMALELPSAGCWTLEFKIGEEHAGSATIHVVPLPTDSGSDG